MAYKARLGKTKGEIREIKARELPTENAEKGDVREKKIEVRRREAGVHKDNVTNRSKSTGKEKKKMGERNSSLSHVGKGV